MGKNLKSNEFQEVAHCGGEISITTKTNAEGNRTYQLGLSHSSPKPASWFAIYALPQGIPIETIQMGSSWNPPPITPSFPVFIGSDSQGYFGHQCPQCNSYWRSRSAAAYWNMTCPHCGIRDKTHNFCTEGQLKYISACCSHYTAALESDKDAQHTIDLDKIADEVSDGAEKPAFYYSEETQQNLYECKACGDINDIIGQYGFCTCCGTRNDLQEFEGKVMPSLREKANKQHDYIAVVKISISEFDALVSRHISFMSKNIPLTPRRKGNFEKVSFHNLNKIQADIKDAFDIDLFKGMTENEIDTIKFMFHRRHVYEHKAGQVDQKYIDDTGDQSVRLNQKINETKDSANQTINLVFKMVKNVHDGFHSIFLPEVKAIK